MKMDFRRRKRNNFYSNFWIFLETHISCELVWKFTRHAHWATGELEYFAGTNRTNWSWSANFSNDSLVPRRPIGQFDERGNNRLVQLMEL